MSIPHSLGPLNILIFDAVVFQQIRVQLFHRNAFNFRPEEISISDCQQALFELVGGRGLGQFAARFSHRLPVELVANPPVTRVLDLENATIAAGSLAHGQSPFSAHCRKNSETVTPAALAFSSSLRYSALDILSSTLSRRSSAFGFGGRPIRFALTEHLYNSLCTYIKSSIC